MIQRQPNSIDRLKACVPSILCLLFVCLLVACVVGGLAFVRSGAIGLVAAVIAGVLCFVSAVAALCVTGVSAGTPNATSGVLLGILVRTAIPFFVVILLVNLCSPLADVGLFGMVLINYLIVLTVETVLAVRVVQAHSIDGGSAVNG